MYKKIIADKIEISASGMKFFVNGFDSKSKMEIKTKLLGYHNIYNILAAIGVALVYGIDKDIIKKGIMFASHIPGRLERLDFGQPFQIFVDYAHTPLALESALSAVSMIAKEKIILVFGCGGDRDRHKRPLMGSIAGTKADFSIITTDNPRNEDPDSIISDIKVGFNNDKYKVIVDRKEAIKEALDIAGPGDIVLIAGKGHENYQVLKNKVIPFNDSEVIKEALLSTTLEIGAR